MIVNPDVNVYSTKNRNQRKTLRNKRKKTTTYSKPKKYVSYVSYVEARFLHLTCQWGQLTPAPPSLTPWQREPFDIYSGVSMQNGARGKL